MEMLAAICATTAATKATMKMPVRSRYPSHIDIDIDINIDIDIDIASSPVSPSLVAKTLMIQNFSVNAGALLNADTIHASPVCIPKCGKLTYPYSGEP